MGNRVYMVHSVTGGANWFPGDPDVIKDQEKRGWVLEDQLPAELNPDAANHEAVFIPAREVVAEDVAAPSNEDRKETPTKKPAKEKAASSHDHEGVSPNG
jgi:hypothetical protein